MRILALILLVLVGSSCGTESRDDSTPELSPTNAQEPTCRRLRVALFQDVSGSGSENRTPRIKVEHLRAVLDGMVPCGGEIAVGTIGSTSNHPLLRVKIEPAPQAPAEPVSGGTAFEQARLRKEHESSVAHHEAAVAAHLEEVHGRVAGFLGEAEDFLSAPADARRTDIWGAIARAGLFLGEPHRSTDAVVKVALFVTDGIGNVNSPRTSLPEGTMLYMVNGDTSLGVLEQLQPLRFEGVPSAVDHILGEISR